MGAEVIQRALKKKQATLSEYDSKQLLKGYGVPVTREYLVKSAKDAVLKAGEFGYPVVLKGCAAALSHKTESDVVRLNLADAKSVRRAFKEIKTNAGMKLDGVLVQEMVKGQRELVIGLIRDAQFGPCVMFGLGGIFTEILKDTSFRVAPINEDEALQMMEDIKAKDILGPVRRKEPADKQTLAKALVGLGNIGMEQDDVAEIDVNPLIIAGDGSPVAVDALVVLKSNGK